MHFLLLSPRTGIPLSYRNCLVLNVSLFERHDALTYVPNITIKLGLGNLRDRNLVRTTNKAWCNLGGVLCGLSFSTSLVLCSRRPTRITLLVRLLAGEAGCTLRTNAYTIATGSRGIVIRYMPVSFELFKATFPHHLTTWIRAYVHA